MLLLTFDLNAEVLPGGGVTVYYDGDNYLEGRYRGGVCEGR